MSPVVNGPANGMPQESEPDLDHEFERIQELAASLLRTRPPGSQALDIQGRVTELMNNIAATADAASASVTSAEAKLALSQRLRSLASRLEGARSPEDPGTSSEEVNLTVALESSRRLFQDFRSADTSPGLRLQALEVSATPVAEVAAPAGAAQGNRSRRTFTDRVVVAAASVAAAVVVAGGVGFIAGDASDSGEAAPDPSSSQVEAGKVAAYMAVIGEFRDDWNTTTLASLVKIKKRDMSEGDCAAQEADLNRWPRKLDMVDVGDAVLQDAGARYFTALQSVASACDGTGLDMRADYLDCVTQLDDVEARALALGWRRSG
jgi:hypothetical protein